jgi:peroxiredoxin Q/BCP
MAISINDKAPDFSAATDGGDKISLKDYKGKWVVLYFYPKDNTSGCTTEACDFRDNMERITSSNAVVIGVSPDSVKSHDGFKNKYNLNFNLVSDEDKSICEKYGVWVEKSMYGRKYMGVLRSTFIIGPDGKIKFIYSKVSVSGHVDAVMSKIQELSA